MEYILVTGGLGFIGSHSCVELKNENLIIVDNLINSKINILDKIKTLSPNSEIKFFDYDLNEEDKISAIFTNYSIKSVIHFAGLKSVSESIKKPLEYYENNVTGTIKLLKVMQKFEVKNLIFSSSATVYGNQEYPVDENSQVGIGITNPYGQTKFMIENILKDLYQSNDRWNIIILRYFNPVGAHPSGLLGEDPNDIPNNLFPYILRTSIGVYERLGVFGNDYQTRDGTCIRDFIHVVDLAQGHLKSLEYLKDKNGIFQIFNLGTGKGVSVLELIETFERVNNLKLKKIFADRREGDLPIVYAKVDKALTELNWKCFRTVEDICRDGYNFIRRFGY